MAVGDCCYGYSRIIMKKGLLTLLVLVLVFGGCGVLRRHEAVTGTLEDAIEIAVDNFLTCRLSDNSDWFKVIPYWNYHDQRDYYNEDGLIEFLILEQDTGQYYFVDTTKLYPLFARYIEKDGKLFTWRDTVADYRLGKETMLALDRYGRLDSIGVGSVWFGVGHEGATYWFCPHDLSNYARHIGHYRPRNPPKLHCRPKKR